MNQILRDTISFRHSFLQDASFSHGIGGNEMVSGPNSSGGFDPGHARLHLAIVEPIAGYID
jgi:hypothetical protein